MWKPVSTNPAAPGLFDVHYAEAGPSHTVVRRWTGTKWEIPEDPAQHCGFGEDAYDSWYEVKRDVRPPYLPPAGLPLRDVGPFGAILVVKA